MMRANLVSVSGGKEIGSCKLYCGDSVDLIPSIEADVVITDPVWPNCPAGLITGSDDPDGLFSRFCGVLPDLRQLVVVLRNDSDPRFLRHVPARLPFQQVAWLQYVMPGYLGRVLGGNECAYVFGRPVKRVPGRTVIPSIGPKVQPTGRPPNGHPCSRPLMHTRWLVKWFSDSGETVCDPFMGSGTTGAACAEIGRSFIGIEVDPNYFDLACARIEGVVSQGDMFLEGTA